MATHIVCLPACHTAHAGCSGLPHAAHSALLRLLAQNHHPDNTLTLPPPPPPPLPPRSPLPRPFRPSFVEVMDALKRLKAKVAPAAALEAPSPSAHGTAAAGGPNGALALALAGGVGGMGVGGCGGDGDSTAVLGMDLGELGPAPPSSSLGFVDLQIPPPLGH